MPLRDPERNYAEAVPRKPTIKPEKIRDIKAAETAGEKKAASREKPEGLAADRRRPTEAKPPAASAGGPEIPSSWQDLAPPPAPFEEKPLSILAYWGKFLFWGALIVFIAVILVSTVFIYLQSSARKVKVELSAPAEVKIGIPFDLTVVYSNNTGGLLRNALLTVELPEGATILAGPERQNFITKDIGDLGQGTRAEEKYTILFIKGENTVKRFNGSLAYQPFALGSRFEEKGTVDVAVKEPAVALDFILPKQILSAEPFEIEVSYHNESDRDFSGLRLQIDYPSTFEFKSSSLKPDSGNDTWVLGDLLSGSEGKFKITGVLFGPSESFYSVAGRLSMSLFGRNYVINEKSGSIKISPSPLSLSISLNGQQDYIARPSDRLSYVLTYNNNSGVGLADVIVKAKLIGEMFDMATLPLTVGFNSVTNTITWNAGTNPELKVIPAGGSGSIGFEIRLKDTYPIKRLRDKNFTVRVEAQIESPTVPYYLAAPKTIGLARLENKIAGRLDLASKVFFRDAASGILNVGPMPPRVNQPTQYTVHWQLTNYSTDMKNIEVRAHLEPNVVWIGKVKSNVNVLPSYNERTQEIIWVVSNLPATRGVINEPAEVIFQIQATPSILNKSAYQPLLSEAKFAAFDEYVNLEVQGFAPPVTTSLPDDLTIGQGGGTVVE